MSKLSSHDTYCSAINVFATVNCRPNTEIDGVFESFLIRYIIQVFLNEVGTRILKFAPLKNFNTGTEFHSSARVCL